MKNSYSYYRTVTLVLVLMLVGLGEAFAQPANDNCANAITLTVNDPCVTGTTAAATTQGGESICAGTFTQSVWYKFVATTTTHIVTLSNNLSGGCHMGSAVYSGSCLPATRLSCVAAAEGLTNQRHSLSGLTVGNTYLIQLIYASGGPCNSAQTFCVGVYTGVDDPTGCLCNSTSASGTGSCHSLSLNGGVPCINSGGCEVSGSNDAIIAVRPTSSPMVITIGNLGSSFTGDVQVMIYSGNNCGALVSVGSAVCGAAPLVVSQAVTVGTKYWIFVSSGGGATGADTEFGICVGNGAACSISGCGAPPPNPPGGAYGVAALGSTVNTANMVQCEIYATGGTTGGNGFSVGQNGVATTYVNTLTSSTFNISTYTNVAYSNTSISKYPKLTVENINCFNTNIDFSAVDPTPQWPTNALGTNATKTTAIATLTIPDNQYTGTVGRRTILFEGDLTNAAATYTATPNSAIPDGVCTAVTSTINISSGCTSVSTSAIAVNVNVTHPRVNDLVFWLTAPNGAILNLFFQTGFTGANLTNTRFSDAGTATINGTAGAPYTGTWDPEATMTTLCGTTPTVASFAAIGGGTINPNGNWTLKFVDGVAGSAGTVNDWSISIPSCTVANQSVNYPDFVNMVMGLPTTGSVLGTNKVCPNVGNTYGSSLAGTPGLTYVWTASTPSANVATFATPTASYTDIYFANNTIATLTYVVSLTVTSECCGQLTPIVTYSVQVLPDPISPTVVDNSLTSCVGGSVTMSAVPAAGYTYAWYDAVLGGNLLATGDDYILTYTPSGVTTYYVEGINTQGCPSVRTPVEVLGTNTPPSVNPVSICAPGNVTFPVVTPLPGATYTWYDSACGGTTLQQNTSISFTQNIAATQTFFVNATEPGCAPSTCSSFTATLGAAPTTLYWNGMGTNTVNNWFDPNNWSSNIPQPTFTTSLSVAASPTNGSCTGIISTITVTGFPLAVSTTGITVKLNASNADAAEIDVFLVAPDGSILELVTDDAGTAYTNTVFSDAGGSNITAGAGTHTGTFQPEGTNTATCSMTPTVTTFGGIGGGSIAPNGNWILYLWDDRAGGGSNTTFTDWSITFPAVLPVGNCLPSCATDVVIGTSPATAVSNAPKIGFVAATPKAFAGNITLAAGNILSFTNSKSVLEICGNFNHNGTLVSNDLGLVSFVGIVPQTYTNTTTVLTVSTQTRNSFNNVVINNTALTPTLTVNGNMTVGNGVTRNRGILTFISGVIELPANNMLIMNNRTATALSGQALTNYVNTVNPTTSWLRRYLATTGGSYDFPVGNANRNSYQLQNLNFNTGHGIDFMDVNFSNPANATGTGLPMLEPSTIYTYTSVLDIGGINATTGNANGGVWTSTPNVAGTATYTCTLYGTNFTPDAAATRYTVLKRATSGPGAWLLDGTYVSSTLATPITVVRSGMAGFSQFAIGKSISVIPLPVKLANLTATCNDDVITVKWSTSSEKSMGTFTLEKSNNGREFAEVKTVKSAGNSTIEQYYSAIDSKPFEGTTYYRLKIVDQNGMIDYSKVIEAVSPCAKGNETFYIFPNPARTEAKVVFSAAGEGIAIVKVKNAVGQEVILNKVETVAGENTCQLNLNGFATGVYMVSVTMNEETQTGKLVVNNR